MRREGGIGGGTKGIGPEEKEDDILNVGGVTVVYDARRTWWGTGERIRFDRRGKEGR